jgi:hypothetical protein
MRASRGMGDIRPSKMPKKKTIVRKDKPQDVEMYKEGGKTKDYWIKDAIKKPGSLRKSLGVKEGQNIPAGKLAKAAKASGKMGQRARLAQTLKKMK